MLSDNVMSQLGELNRRRAAGMGAAETVRAIASLPRMVDAESASEPVDQLPAGSESVTVAGKHWVRRVPVIGLWPGVDKCLRDWPDIQRVPGAEPPKRCAELESLLRWFPRSTAFLDLETCGFAGSMVFLIGVIHHDHEQLVLTQLLARHYGEEKSILHGLCDILADQRVLVTFNGKSFDWPMVVDRLTLHRIEDRVIELSTAWVHCDLLHHARRRWRRKLPDCKLQTLERYLCGRRRVDDIAGREIPEAYHDFVRSGDAWLVRRVLHHNALDLVTLIQLARGLVVPAAERS